MNPDQPSREQIETRITALLLGELPAEEAALLRYTISQDEGLQQLHDELQATLVLVREAAKHPEEPTVEQAKSLKLSADRRQKLLTHFKTPRTEVPQDPLFWLKRIQARPLIEVLAVVAIIALLAAMLLPTFSKAKMKSHRVAALSEASQKAAEVEFQAEEKRLALKNTPATTAPAIPMLLGNTVTPSHALLDETYAPMANSGAASEPKIVTRSLEPQSAGTPAIPVTTKIILPQTEQPSETLAQAGTAAEAETGHIYSQKVVGYANVATVSGTDSSTLSSPAPATAAPPAKTESGGVTLNYATQNREQELERLWKVPGQSPGHLPDLAQDQNSKSNPGFQWNLNAASAKSTPAGGDFGFVSPSSPHTVALNDSGGRQPIEAFPPTAVAGSLPTISNESPQLVPPPPLSVYEPLAMAPAPAPAATPSPVATIAPATDTEYTIVSGDTLNKIARKDSVTLKALEEANPGIDPKKLKPGKKLTIPASPMSTIAARAPAPIALPAVMAAPAFVPVPVPVTASASAATSIPLTNGRKINGITGYGGIASMAGGGIGGSALQQRNLADSFNIDRSQKDGNRPGDTLDSTKAALDAYKADAEQAEKHDQQNTTNNQPFENATRNLDEKLKMHQLLYSKLEAEKLDLSLPEHNIVQIIDPAEPNRGQTFWQRLTGQYESTARIKVENDVPDILGKDPAPSANVGFDPYFVQTTFEVIQSPIVLSNVVERLDLTSAWAKKNGGEKMSESDAISELKSRLDLHPVKDTKLIEIGVTSADPNEAATIANEVARAYKDYRFETSRWLTTNGVAFLDDQFAQQEKEIRLAQVEVERLSKESAAAQATEQADLPIRKPAPNAPVPQPEILTRDNNFSTFSLNVSDVSFKFAEASLQNGKLPDTAAIRSEEFINAFDYRDPEAAPGQPMAFTSERARYPFAHNRELLRFAVKAAATGRQEGRALNLVLLLDNSGSMERADRVAIIREALRVLATQLQPQDTVSVVTFSRTARLWADGVSGDKAAETFDRVGGITPEGGTNLEEAMRLAYETAHRHYLANGMNRVVLLTDGAANLGNVEPNILKEKVEAQRKQGIALDCFGIGWEDYNDDLLEQLSSNGDGRYAFLNSPEDAAKDFAAKLAGALQIAAADVKVQVEFNPQRVISYRQIGYATHQLTKEQFRDNTVAAGQIAAQEAGNALYTIETNPNGSGPIATVHVRYRIPGTGEYREHSWDVDYTGGAPALEKSSPAMRLAASASAFSEWLAASPYAQEVTPEALLNYLSGVPEIYGADDRPKQLETMIREGKSLEGK